MDNLERNVEVEVINTLVHNMLPQDRFFGHYMSDRLVFIDNINGGFDSCPMPMHRETGVGYRYNTWCRARSIVHALLKSFGLHPILSFITEEYKSIKGMGISDDLRYAEILEKVFTYVNTYYHQEPKLDLMHHDRKFDSTFDFIICSDVLEHTIGTWQDATHNIYKYLKPGGVLILTVPLKRDIAETIEHYPGATGYEVTFAADAYHSTLMQYVDRSELVHDPVFHGGPGNTLEMRIFSLPHLKSELTLNGFVRQEFYELNQPLFGILPSDQYEGVLAVFK